MPKCFNINECEEMIKKIKEAQKKYPDGFAGKSYSYWCPSCDTFNHEDWCQCDNDE